MNSVVELERDSKQLELELFVGVPWSGRSSRGLTKARILFILNPRGAGQEPVFRDPNQYELFKNAAPL